MASKGELNNAVQELRQGQRLETLEFKVAALEGDEGIEPILTCVQCSAKYKESENAEGGCKYHSSGLTEIDRDYYYRCCSEGSDSYVHARTLPGCTEGKHRSKHHTEYSYAAYYFHMSDLSDKAKQMWLTMDLVDHVTECCEWAEVGLSDEGKMFILVGTVHDACGTCAEFSSEELRQCKDPSFTALEMSGSIGWAIKADIHSSDSEANAITVSIKPASSSIPLVKRIGLYFDGDVPMPGKVECLSDPSPSKPSAPYTVPEPTYEGPMLVLGKDYSKDRRNDYETETTNNCRLKLQQHGCVDVNSNILKSKDGKWNNFFATTLKVTNTSKTKLAVTEVYGEYMSEAGEWVKCDRLWTNSASFSMEPASTKILTVRLAIAFSDDPPRESEACRAHRSLPQPLHLRVTFVDQWGDTAFLEFEQGNPPLVLDLATRESRKVSYNLLQFHLFADDTEKCNRSDATIYYGSDGVLNYCLAPCSNDIFHFNFSSSVASATYNAKKAGNEEFELTDMKVENQGSTIRIFVVVDLEAGLAYALKVVITTPTSSATGYYLLPYDDDSLASLTVEPQNVPIKSEFTVNWSVPRASKADYMLICPRYRQSTYSVGEYDVQEMLGMDGVASTGSLKMQAPDTPGQYEVRYYPRWLDRSTTGYRHHGYWAPATFTVTL